MGHEEYKEMLSARALAALDREAEHTLNQHLSDCAACREELDRLNETAALLALTAHPVEPSPQLREQILRRIKTEAQDARPEQLSSSGSKTGVGSQVMPFRPPPRTGWRPIGSLGAIAATLVFAALLVSLIMLWEQNRALKAELAKSTSQMRSAQAELAEWRDLFTTPGAKMLELSGTKMAPGANAKLAFDKNGHAMLMAKGLPVAPSGKAYQLWYIVDNKPMPGKTFKTDAAGNGTTQEQMPPVALNATSFAITMEPEGGMQAPTGAIYLHSGS